MASRKIPITTDEIATVQKDITQYYMGKVLINPDKVLSSEARGDGLGAYEDLERDDRVFAEMQKRKLAVTSKEWTVEPASDDAKDVDIAEFVEEVFKKAKFDRLCNEALDGILKGFKPCEVMWDYSEGQTWIKEFRGRDPRRFTFDLENNLRLLTWADMINGEELPERKFQLFRFGEKNNNPFGIGLGNKLYWPVWFKKNGVKFWAVFLEKFGQPTPWGKYPSGTGKDKQTDLLDAIKAMQTDVGVITPDNMTIELLEAARSSSVDSYEKWGTFWNEAITLIILGQTATTTGTPGKLGSEEARSDVRQELVKADADNICEWINDQSIPWLVDYNFRGVTEYPKIWKRTDPEEDLKPLAERDQILARQIGVPMTKKYFYETYGIPEPAPEEELVTVPQTPDPFALSLSKGGIPGGSGFAERISDFRLPIADLKSKIANRKSKMTFGDVDSWISAYMDAIAPSLRNVRAGALGEIEAWLRSQSSPPSEAEFTAKIQSILGSAYAGIDRVAVTDAVTGIYAAVKAVASIGFGGSDVRAVNFLANLDHFYLSKFLTNPDAQAATLDFLKGRFLDGGEGLFGAGDPRVWKEFSNALSRTMTDLEGYQVRRIVETGVVRAQNWGHVAQLNDAGIAEIEIVEPTQECNFCAAMNGQIIQVGMAFTRMTQQANMSPDEYEADLRANQPQFNGSQWNVADFVDQGLLPPYHPHCRGRVIMRST